MPASAPPVSEPFATQESLWFVRPRRPFGDRTGGRSGGRTVVRLGRRFGEKASSIVDAAGRRKVRDPIESFDWPAEPSIEALGRAIAAARGLRIILRPIPEEMRHHEISGLTTVTGRTAHVFYDADLSPLNREQTILHEYAHILHGDVRAEADCTHLRSVFDDPVEKRAETTGMRLLQALRRRRKRFERQRASEVLVFLSGAGEGDTI